MNMFANKKKLICEAIASFTIFMFCLCLFSTTAKADTPGTVNDNNVNVRAGAGTESNSLGKVNSGDKVTIIEETNGWYKITTEGGLSGYIKADFVTKSADGGTTTTTTTTTTPANVTAMDAKAAYISKDTVNIRSQASANSDLVAKAQLNSEVTVTGETTAADGYKWYQISFTADGATKKGFIRSDLITFTKPTQAPAETNIDSNNPEPDVTKEPEPEVTQEPEPEVTQEPEKEIVKAYEVKLLDPIEEPANMPEGYNETTINPGNGEDVRVWNNGDFYIVYGMNEAEQTGWYVLDRKTNNFVSYDGLFVQPSKKASSDGSTIFGIQMKWILVGCVVLIILLLGAVFFLALKLSRGVEDDDDYEYDDYEEDDDDYEEDIPVSSIEEEPSRKARSAKPQKAGKKSAKDKFLDYFTTTVDDDEEEYYDDVDEDDEDEDIDFIDI